MSCVVIMFVNCKSAFISICDADTPVSPAQASSTTKCILSMSNASVRPSLFTICISCFCVFACGDIVSVLVVMLLIIS